MQRKRKSKKKKEKKEKEKRKKKKEKRQKTKDKRQKTKEKSKKKRGLKGVPPETGRKIELFIRNVKKNRNGIEARKKIRFWSPRQKYK